MARTSYPSHASPQGPFDASPMRRGAGLLGTWFASPVRPPLASGEQIPADADADVRCILAIGAALLGYGLPAHRVEESVLRLAHAFDRGATVFGLPTALIITLRGPTSSDIYIVRAEPGAIDLARLEELHALVGRVERKLLDADAAERVVTEILSAPRRTARWVELLSVTLVAFGGTLMLGGGFDEAIWSSALGLGVGMLLALGSSHPTVARVLPLVAAAAVTLACAGLSHAGLVSHPLVATFAALLVLLPGLMLTLAMTELATGHLVSGTARCMGALIVFLQLGLGVLLGARLGHLQDAPVALLQPAALAPAACGALMLACAFLVLLSVRTADIAQTLLVSVVSFLVCRYAGEYLGTEVGVMLAVGVVGSYSNIYARRHDRPSSTLTLPGVLMLVPGSLGLMSVSAAALYDPTSAFELGFRMLMILIALSSGLLFSAAAIPPRTGV